MKKDFVCQDVPLLEARGIPAEKEAVRERKEANMTFGERRNEFSNMLILRIKHIIPDEDRVQEDCR